VLQAAAAFRYIAPWAERAAALVVQGQRRGPTPLRRSAPSVAVALLDDAFAPVRRIANAAADGFCGRTTSRSRGSVTAAVSHVGAPSTASSSTV
jgi:hypothetical protein